MEHECLHANIKCENNALLRGCISATRIEDFKKIKSKFISRRGKEQNHTPPKSADINHIKRLYNLNTSLLCNIKIQLH